jgi:hypothetical protein
MKIGERFVPNPNDTVATEDEAVAALQAFDHYTHFPSDENADIVRYKIKELAHDRDVWLAMTHVTGCSQCADNYGANLCDHGKNLMETARPGSTKR